MCKYWVQVCERCFNPRRGGYCTPNRDLTDNTCDQKLVGKHHTVKTTLYWHERRRNRALADVVLNEAATDNSTLILRIWLTWGCRFCFGRRGVFEESEKIETIHNAAKVDASTLEEEKAKLYDAEFEFLQAKKALAAVVMLFPEFHAILKLEKLELRRYEREHPDEEMEKFNAWVAAEGELEPVSLPQSQGLNRGLPAETEVKGKNTLTGTFIIYEDGTDSLFGDDDVDMDDDDQTTYLEYESDSSVPYDAVIMDLNTQPSH